MQFTVKLQLNKDIYGNAAFIFENIIISTGGAYVCMGKVSYNLV